MSDHFSFSSADDLVKALKSVNAILKDKNQQLLSLYRQLGDFFRDSGYDDFRDRLQYSYVSCNQINQELDLIIAAVSNYREKLYQLYIEDLIEEIPFSEITYTPGVRFGDSGLELERKNRQLEFQNEVKMKMKDNGISLSAKKAYALLGSKCAIASNEFTGTAHYSLDLKCISFNLKEDLQNQCGQLATYFHETGHMIDHQTKDNGFLSDDAEFCRCLREDCENYIAFTQQRYACSREIAYLHIRRELREDNDLYADVSDIMGGLTDCQCQNLWGHSRKYWNEDPSRVQKEAFANMYSTIMGNEYRAAAMKKYFPSAYSRFEKLLEESFGVTEADRGGVK